MRFILIPLAPFVLVWFFLPSVVRHKPRTYGARCAMHPPVAAHFLDDIRSPVLGGHSNLPKLVAAFVGAQLLGDSGR